MTKITLAILTAVSSLSLSSCQDEDYGYSADQIAYQTNFQKAYGNISEIPTWDLSSYNLKKLGLEGGPSNDFAALGRAKTRAFSASASAIMLTPAESNYKVQSTTTTWLNNNLAEKVPHHSLGEAFTLINPYYETDGCGEFLIIPIYQGASGMTWDLHLVDDQYDYSIWSKSKDFTYTINHNDWEEFFFGDLANGSINLNEAFLDVNSYDDVFVSFMPNAGSMKGRFYVRDGNYNQRAYVTDLEEKTFSAGNSKEDNSVSLKSIIGKSYARNDNSSQSVVAGLNNIYFEPSDEQDGIVIDPYPAERLHVWVKFTNPNPQKTTGKELINFSASNQALRPSGSDDRNVSYFKGHTINRSDVTSKVMRIDATKLGREFSLYLETQYSDQYNQDFSKEGTKHRSNGDPHMMLALHNFNTLGAPIDFAQTLVDLKILSESEKSNASDYQYMVIGCEDANGPSSDWDYNDVVLLFVGLPKVPKIATNVVQKRYMIEDLGSTFDFDFNDIVVDVTQERILTIGTGDYVDKQVVSIAHLCGTIPFDVHFKNSDNSTTSIFGKLMGQNDGDGTGGDGYDPKEDVNYINKYVKTYTGEQPWDPNNNNIVVYVWPNAAGLTDVTGSGNSSLYNDGSNNLLDIKNAQRIDFPKAGQFPYIIAVDQDINWMPELHSVPEAWFTTTEIKNKYPENESNPGIVVPSKPSVTPSVSGYGEEITGEFLANNQDGTTTVKVGEFLTSKYLNPGRSLTFTVVMSSTCLPSQSNNNSTAVPEVKGQFTLNNKLDTEKLYDVNINLKDFKSPSDNSNIIIQQFTLNDALTIDDKENDANDQYLLSVANAERLLFNINYATYGFKDVGDGNPQAKLYVNWDKRPALKLTLEDPEENVSFTVRQNNNNVNATNGVYYLNPNAEYTVSGNADCKYFWIDGRTEVSCEGTNSTSTLNIGNVDKDIRVRVYHAIIPEIHLYKGSGSIDDNNNFDGKLDPTSDHKITLTWNGTSRSDRIYVPFNAEVTVELTLNTSKYELVGWRYGVQDGTPTQFTITKSNRNTQYTPQAAIKEVSDVNIDASGFGVKYIYNENSDKVNNNNVGTDYEVVDLTRALKNYAGGKIEVRIVNKTNSNIGAEIKLRKNNYQSYNINSGRIVVGKSEPGVFELTDQAYTDHMKDPSDGKLVMFIDKSAYEAFKQSDIYIKYNQEINIDFTGTYTSKSLPSPLWANNLEYKTWSGDSNEWIEITSVDNPTNAWDTQMTAALGYISKGAIVSFSYNTWTDNDSSGNPVQSSTNAKNNNAKIAYYFNSHNPDGGASKGGEVTFGNTITINTQEMTGDFLENNNMVLSIHLNKESNSYKYIFDNIKIKITYFQ